MSSSALMSFPLIICGVIQPEVRFFNRAIISAFSEPNRGKVDALSRRAKVRASISYPGPSYCYSFPHR